VGILVGIRMNLNFIALRGFLRSLLTLWRLMRVFWWWFDWRTFYWFLNCRAGV
jgi:hypothetical protein